MKFSEWLTAVGDDHAAKVLKATPRAIRSWRAGERKPLPAKAIEIAKILKGKVKLEEIYS